MVAAEEKREAVEAARLTWRQRRGELWERFGEVASDLLDQLPDSKPADIKNLVTAAAIRVDKAETLTSAEREGREPITPDEVDREIERLTRAYAGKRIGELEAQLAKAKSSASGAG